MIVLPVLDESTVVRASSVALMRVPRNTSHCAPASAQNHPVSPLLVRPVAAFAILTNPDTAPVSVRFPVPVELVVSLHRSMTLCAMADYPMVAEAMPTGPPATMDRVLITSLPLTADAPACAGRLRCTSPSESQNSP